MGVHAYEVWNEPNIVNFWAPGPDPARYTQLLKLAYPAITAARRERNSRQRRSLALRSVRSS